MQHPDISLSSHNGSKTRLGWSAVLEKISCPDYFNGGISQKKKKNLNFWVLLKTLKI